MVTHRQAVCGRISITVIDSPSRKAFLRPFTLFRKPDCTFSPSLSTATYGVVKGVAIMMPARKNVSAADNRQKGQNACSMNACT